MITDEAVEAAADIVYRTSGRKRVMSYEQARPTCTDEARQILEAAAPHMLAEAWDAGNIAGVFDLPSEKHATTNPYRSQA